MAIKCSKEARDRSVDTKSIKQKLAFQDRIVFCTCCHDLGLLPSVLCMECVFISRKNNTGKTLSARRMQAIA